MVRIGNQSPTFTNVNKSKKSKGKEAIECYERTERALMDWQCEQLNNIMAIGDDGLWVNMKYGISLSRRNGKGEVLAAREMWGITQAGEKVMHTAHRTTTSHDAFTRLYMLLKAQGYEEHSKKKKEMPEKSFYASKLYGLERIEVFGGGIVDFRTRTNNGGLGEGFDLLIIDEAQEYTSKQESALSYTVSASRNPQTIMVGTPPTATSGGDVFKRTRDSVMQGTSIDLGWAEWSIPQLTKDIDNVDLWYQCNPSLGSLLSERNIRAELTNGEIDFNIQRLGLWLAYSQQSAVLSAEWDELRVDFPPALNDARYWGVKYGKDGTNVALSVAIKTKDGRVFVETIDCVPVRRGNGWMFDYFNNPKTKAVIVDGDGKRDLLAEEMKDFGLKKPIIPTVREVVEANAAFERELYAKQICHTGQPALAAVVSNCEKRAIGSHGGFGYSSLTENDIAIMDSMILALWQAAQEKERKPQSISY